MPEEKLECVHFGGHFGNICQCFKHTYVLGPSNSTSVNSSYRNLAHVHRAVCTRCPIACTLSVQESSRSSTGHGVGCCFLAPHSCLTLFESWTAACQASLSSPKVCPSSCPLHQWCHSAVSSSDPLYFFCSQSLLASESSPMIWLFTSGDQNTGASATALPMSYSGLIFFKIDWFNLAIQGVVSNTTVQKHQLLSTLAFFMIQISQLSMTTGKTIALTRWTFTCHQLTLFTVS